MQKKGTEIWAVASTTSVTSTVWPVAGDLKVDVAFGGRFLASSNAIVLRTSRTSVLPKLWIQSQLVACACFFA